MSTAWGLDSPSVGKTYGARGPSYTHTHTGNFPPKWSSKSVLQIRICGYARDVRSCGQYGEPLWMHDGQGNRVPWEEISIGCVQITGMLGVCIPLRTRCPVGMGEALYFLAASLRKGRYTKCVQYATTRITSSWLTNLEGASSRFQVRFRWRRHRGWRGFWEKWGVQERHDLVVEIQAGNEAQDGGSQISEWSVHARHGCGSKQGMVRRGGWCAKGGSGKLDVFYVLIGLGAGLRGEEVPLTSWQGLQTFCGHIPYNNQPKFYVSKVR